MTNALTALARQSIAAANQGRISGDPALVADSLRNLATMLTTAGETTLAEEAVAAADQIPIPVTDGRPCKCGAPAVAERNGVAFCQGIADVVAARKDVA